MAKSPLVRNTTKLYVLKSRYTGRTGFAGKFTYVAETGRLVASEDQTDHEDEDAEAELRERERFVK